MLKNYTDYPAPSKELKLTPDSLTLKAILNYSKALEVKKIKKERPILINLN